MATLTLGLATPLHAQQPLPASTEYPTCASLHQLRLAVMPPPGANTGKLKKQLLEGRGLPAGTDIRFIDASTAPPLIGGEQTTRELSRILQELYTFDHVAASGEAVSIVVVKEDGSVAQVVPGAKQPAVDRALTRFWKEQHFRPLVLGGCRAPAWVRVPVTFDVKWDASFHTDSTYVHYQYPTVSGRQ